MELTIKKIGRSAGLILPASLMKSQRLAVGTVLDVEVESGQMVLSVKKPRYKLADLIAQCDLSAPANPEAAEWENMRPVGREVR